MTLYYAGLNKAEPGSVWPEREMNGGSDPIVEITKNLAVVNRGGQPLTFHKDTTNDSSASSRSQHANSTA